MKILNQIKILWLIAGCTLICGLASNLNAQDTNVDWGTASDDQVILQAIELTTPIPSNEVPAFATFYSAQHSPISSQPWPPLPGNMNDFNAWDLGSNIWVLDDLDFDYNAPSASASQSMMAMDAGGISPPGSDGTNIYSPAGDFVSFDPGTNLWIAQEAVSGGNFTGILSNTISGVEYQLLSMNSLNSGQWAYQGEPFLAYTNWAAWSLPFNPTTNFFLNALSFQDDSGTGIPDWWWLKYFGQDTNVDPYADPVGDGWTLQQDFENGLSPTSWNTPPAPQGLAVDSFNSASDTATLSWLPSSGPVTGYTIQTPNGTFNIGDVTSYIDDESSIGATYSVEADYAGGPSAWSGSVSVQQSGLSANIIAGPQGSAYLAVSSMPNATYELEVTRIDEVATYDFGDSSYNVTNYITVTDATNGLYSLANVTVPPDRYVQEYPISQYGSEGYKTTENWYVQAIETNGLPNYPVYAGSSYTSSADGYESSWTVPPYFDGREQLKQNLVFLLREANEVAPFYYEVASGPYATDPIGFISEPTNYEYAGFFNSDNIWNGYMMTPGDNSMDVCRPFEENSVYANFVFSTSNVDTNEPDGNYGMMTTGVSVSHLDIYSGDLLLTNNPTYQFQSPVTSGTTIPSLLTTNYAQSLFVNMFNYVYSTIYAWVGMNDDGTMMLTGQVNYFGLPFDSLLLCPTADDSNYNFILDQTIYPGQSTPYWFGYPYPDVAQPQFQVAEYDFWNPSLDSLPGGSNFSPTNASREPIIVSVGGSTNVACYAKLAVTNSAYSGVYGYLSEYFTNAYQIDTNGNATTNITGILSPYGAFFATQPGPAALETMPDIDTGQQGTDIVYCVSLNVDKNHDGAMDTNFFGDDTTSQSSPMEFWINNGNDGTGVGEAINAPTLPDSTYDDIQSMRELENFARLWICGLPVLPYNYQVTLSWANISSGNPSIKIFPSQQTDGGTEYLTDTNVAQNYIDNPLTEPCFGTVTNGQNFQFPDLYFTEAGDKHLLFEGVTPGTGELILTVADNNGNTIAQTGVWLDLHDVRGFYEREIITNNISGAISNWSSSIEMVQQQIVSNPDEDTNIIVYVHGGANTDFNWLSRSDTVFKRLYWAGYHGRLVTVRWPSPTETQIVYYGNQWFNYSELIAYKSASSLKVCLDQLHSQFPSYQMNLFPQSLGGAVVSEALYEGAQFNNLILCNVAMAASCYDINAPTNDSLANIQQTSPTPDWQPMGYHGVYTNLIGNAVNYFNTNDNFMSLWLFNQETFKPNPAYSYNGINTSNVYDSYLVTDTEESRGMVARSRTVAIGNIGPLSGETTQGIIQSAVDLHAQFGIGQSGAEHSAFFTRPIQTILPLYFQILNDCNIQPSDLQ